MDHSFHIRPFAFERVFEASPTPGTGNDSLSADELRLRVAVLEADLVVARQDRESALTDARGEAYEAGRAAARLEREAALLAAVDALHATVEEIEGELTAIADRCTREAAEVAHAAAEMLAARALTEMPGAAIDAAIGRVLQQVQRGQEIQVSVAPSLVEEIERLIAVRQAGDRRRLALTVVGDATLAEGDAHIHWDRGGVVLDGAARAEAVRQALAGLLSGPPPQDG